LIVLGNQDDRRSFSASVGQCIDVTLQTIGPGQYGEPRVTSSSVGFVGMSAAPGPVNPGGQRQRFQFKAASVGSAVIHIPHSRGMAFTFTMEVAK